MIQASYFDGKSARAQSVTLAIQSDSLLVQRDDGTSFRHPLRHLQFDEAFKGAARRIDLGGGAILEVADREALQAALERSGHRVSSVQYAQNSWGWVAACLAGLLLVIVGAYLYLIPFAARHLASWLPESVENTLGNQAWPMIEEQMFKPSKLSADRQTQLTQRYAAITQKLAQAPPYQLVFRASSMGPNAIAVPGGRLVMTDELVALAKDDQALMGVLLHELGHIKYRHSLRNIIQATAISAVISVWLGDLSSLVATIPAALATMKYSRDLEAEADDFAVASMRAQSIPGQPTADLFAALEKEQADKAAGKDASDSILSSHPVTSERIKKFSAIK